MTKSQMYLRMVTSSLLRRRSRMIVALLAIAIGATILSGLVTIYYDVPRQMGKEFRSYGANMLFITSGTESFTQEDFLAAKECIPSSEIVGITPFKYQNIKINSQPFMLAGTDFEQIRKTSPYWLVNGEYPEPTKNAVPEVLVGQTVSSTIGISVGKEFVLSGMNAEGKQFDIRVKTSGIVQTGGTEEECVYISLSDLENAVEKSGLIDVVECSISSSRDELSSMAEKISEKVPAIKPSLVKRVTQSEGTVLGKLQALVCIVTIVVLVLTMVCVATTMMAVVAERRKEIGLKKALGAANKEIVQEFLGEGLLLGALGGILGVVLGFFFAQAVSVNVFARTINFQILIVPVTIFVSVLVTAIACVIPVHSATEVDPAIVLRGE